MLTVWVMIFKKPNLRVCFYYGYISIRPSYFVFSLFHACFLSCLLAFVLCFLLFCLPLATLLIPWIIFNPSSWKFWTVIFVIFLHLFTFLYSSVMLKFLPLASKFLRFDSSSSSSLLDAIWRVLWPAFLRYYIDRLGFFLSVTVLMFLRHLIIFSELGFSYSGIVTCLSNDVYLKLENGDGRKKGKKIQEKIITGQWTEI